MIIIDKNTSDKEFIDLLLYNRKITNDKKQEFLSPSTPQTFNPKDFGINPNDFKKSVDKHAFTRYNK